MYLAVPIRTQGRALTLKGLVSDAFIQPQTNERTNILELFKVQIRIKTRLFQMNDSTINPQILKVTVTHLRFRRKVIFCKPYFQCPAPSRVVGFVRVAVQRTRLVVGTKCWLCGWKQ